MPTLRTNDFDDLGVSKIRIGYFFQTIHDAFFNIKSVIAGESIASRCQKSSDLFVDIYDHNIYGINHDRENLKQDCNNVSTDLSIAVKEKKLQHQD